MPVTLSSRRHMLHALRPPVGEATIVPHPDTMVGQGDDRFPFLCSHSVRAHPLLDVPAGKGSAGADAGRRGTSRFKHQYRRPSFFGRAGIATPGASTQSIPQSTSPSGGWWSDGCEVSSRNGAGRCPSTPLARRRPGSPCASTPPASTPATLGAMRTSRRPPDFLHVERHPLLTFQSVRASMILGEAAPRGRGSASDQGRRS